MSPNFRKSTTALALVGALAGFGSTAHAAGEAKNVIFFLGDGMGPVTVTAARIYKGEKQLAATPGSLASSERAKLAMQTLGTAARIKTFSRDGQTTDSAPSMAAYMTGVKMNNEVISMSAETSAYRPDGTQFVNGENSACAAGNGTPAVTLLELSKAKGRSVGAVSTTRVTHATPATTFAHVCNRNAYNTIAEQGTPGHPNYNTALGTGIDVLLGGGLRNYQTPDVNPSSRRTDGVNLISLMQTAGYSVATTGGQLAALDATRTDRILGLFSQAEMAYELDRVNQNLDQPSLTQMTEKALDVLSRNNNGFFLMVEGGRIDHALHGSNAKRALEDTLAFDQAVEAAKAYMERKDPGLANTLIVVTADHDHAMAFNGYTKIGNPILGKVVDYQSGQLAMAADGKPYTTLVFGNGGRPTASAGSQVNAEDGNKPWTAPPRAADRQDLTNVDTTQDNFLQEVGINLGTPGAETHGGGDVMLYSGGAGSKIFKGTMDNTQVFSKVKEAAGL
ncbi:alkaline phosphatase [Pseudorhodoferax aquiterrae]|uniref:Alkaline phosphatase n=1 Tax=Pseudorhodoferax aquiterrae TaxID=747304 RepID=A0ABQ3G6I2_9BURK|nr:alkaline phosphatase [Pseudorhodoferax aquiterrae]GHC93054.1 alkaline phosphatase [Pseudorhodoferax aquiterrae]